MTDLTRRQLIRASTGAVALGALTACSRPSGQGTGAFVTPTDPAIAALDQTRARAGRRTVTAALHARRTTVDLGGRTVTTWAYGDDVPGPVIRATAGDLVTVQVTNDLPTSTSVHWHGLRLRNDMDGVPGLTQPPIEVGSTFTYSFTPPDPGTYWYHPHTGIQVDRALHGALIVDDPAEPGDYDVEWVVVLDDWIDGTGDDPDRILARFRAEGAHPSGMDMSGMPGMEGMTHSAAPTPDAAPTTTPDAAASGTAPTGTAPTGTAPTGTGGLYGMGGSIMYPHYLVNGRLPTAPVTFTAKPGQRARIRFVNAGSDTAFRVALGDHRMTVTHTDGYACTPSTADAVLMGMGERYDVLVTLKDGVFPLAVLPEGKPGRALALVRTGAGSPPPADVRPAELDGDTLIGAALDPAASNRLPAKGPDRLHQIVLEGSMNPYHWTINGKSHPDVDPFPVARGERLRIQIMNRTRMFHPWHIHGHTFALARTGLRKDTVILRPMQVMYLELQADNPGLWMTHCHNLYHAESGMMATLAYLR